MRRSRRERGRSRGAKIVNASPKAEAGAMAMYEQEVVYTLAPGLPETHQKFVPLLQRMA